MDWDEFGEDEKKDSERDAITAKMGEYLLKGVAMLDEYCDCGVSSDWNWMGEGEWHDSSMKMCN